MSMLQDLVQAIISAAKGRDATAVDDAINALRQWLKTHPDKAAEIEVAILRGLRSGRHFEALKLLSETLNGYGHPDPAVRLMLAQGLIDTGAPSTAIDILQRTRIAADDRANRIERTGLTGRAFKDIFQGLRSTHGKRAADILGLAIAQYAAAFNESGQANFWTGENLLALMHRAAILDIPVDIGLTQSDLCKSICDEIEKTPASDRGYWHWASLAVTHVATRDWAQAADALKLALESDGVDAFSLAGTIRQLRDWWDIDDSGPEAAGLVAALQAKLLQLPGAHLEMNSDQIRAASAVPDESFEKIFGSNGPTPRGWLLDFLNTGASVGQITSARQGGVGTCFIVDGGLFHDTLAGEKLILTNEHVVSPAPENYRANPPLRVNSAKAKFEVFSEENGTCEIDAKEIVWSSGNQDHDACLIRLAEPVPDELPALPVVDYVPVADPDSGEGVYIIGHPGGRVLSYSMQNNELLDHDCSGCAAEDVTPRRIHYFTPTEPGSSGSPALNSELKVIGLHHAGGKYMSMLHGKEGTYPANEAIWIESICRAARKDISAGKSRFERPQEMTPNAAQT